MRKLLPILSADVLFHCVFVAAGHPLDVTPAAEVFRLYPAMDTVLVALSVLAYLFWAAAPWESQE